MSKPQHFLERCEVVMQRISAVMSTLAGVGILGLMLLTVWDVSFRETRGRGIEGATELSEVALVAVVFLGMTAAQLNRSHISTPMLTARLPARLGHAVRALSLVVAALFVAWMTLETARTGMSSYQAGEFRYGTVNVPIWPARLVIPLGLAGLTIALVLHSAIQVRKCVLNMPKDIVDYEAMP